MLGSTTVTRRSFGASTIDAAGRRTAGAATDEQRIASVQPAPGTTTTTDIDGQRSPDAIIVFDPAGANVWRGVDQYVDTAADRVFITEYNAWYEVQAVADHQPIGMTLRHAQVSALRVQEGQP